MPRVEQTVKGSIFVAFCFSSFLQDKLKEGYIKDIKATFQQFSDFLGERKFLAGDKVLQIFVSDIKLRHVNIPKCLQFLPALSKASSVNNRCSQPACSSCLIRLSI